MTELTQKFFSSKMTTAGLAVVLVAIVGFGLVGAGAGKKGVSAKPLEPAPAATVATATSTIAPAAAIETAAGQGPESAPGDENAAAASIDIRSDASDEPVADPQADEPENAAADFGATTVQEPGPDPVRLAAASDARGANSFNRLLKKPASAPNAPPARDGIHDPANPGTELLQWPSVAFEGLPKTADGNKIDWVKALDSGKISPRYVATDPKAEPFLLDLVIVRQVKGSMPNVVYPHLQHTQWLDCSNCHDEIFIPQKGANQISMAGILLGQKCGVCHGKVAFPVSDCRRCHAQPKTEAELRALADRSNWAKGGGSR